MGERRSALKTLFLDSSVIFSAANSPFGGSAKLFTLKNTKLLTSSLVLAEVERNVKAKLQSYHLERFLNLAKMLSIYDSHPDEKTIIKAKKVIHPKDAAILVEAKMSKADCVITLDKRHFLTEKVANYLKPQKVLSPKMFFEE